MNEEKLCREIVYLHETRYWDFRCIKCKHEMIFDMYPHDEAITCEKCETEYPNIEIDY